MKIRTLSIVLLAGCCVLLANSAKAQARSVKILKFEVDGKEVRKGFKVLLYIGGKTIEPARTGNSFVVPPEVQGHENIGVRFLSGKYDLLFDSVHVSKFNTDWIIGIDNKPFDAENISSEEPDPPGRQLLVIHYMSFVPKDGGDGTRMIVKVYK